MSKPTPRYTYRAHNGYDTREASHQATVPLLADGTYGPSLTVQAMAEDADLNVLMKRYGITGKMPENPRIPTYGDFTVIKDYRTALDAVRQAHEGFMEIPADIRSQFDNDPQLFLEFTSNPANRAAMVKLGLAKLRPDENDPRNKQPAPAPGAPTGNPPAPGTSPPANPGTHPGS